MKDNLILLNKIDKVAIVTMNRPDKLNALNMEMLYAFKKQVNKIKVNPDIRAVIITGAGDKSFCVGADLEERIGFSSEEIKHFIFTIRNLFDSIESLPKPVIAAINGAAFGGGTELALSCDIRIASDNAIMGLTETRLAVIPGAGGTQRLPRLIGVGKAKEMIFTGRRVEANEACEIGLVNKVCQKDLLMDECLKIAEMICAAGPVAIEKAKYAINTGIDHDLKKGLEIEYNAYLDIIPTDDRIEGLSAFREKRAPIYKGK